MDLRDLIVTPILLFIICGAAYFIRPFLTDQFTRPYFLPALTVKVIGAIAIGILYQFYYGGGDTFMYHTYGSRIVWNAFTDSVTTGMKLLFADGVDQSGIYKYSSNIYFFRDPQSYAVIRVAAFFDLLTFSTYSATAILFALVSFSGMWMFFLTFYEQYPDAHKGLAIASFFIPSVFFWGSGLLKDTLTLGCLGAATYLTYRIFLKRKFGFLHVLLLFVSLYGMYFIKVYILLTFLPASILWIFLFHLSRIGSGVMRILISPFVIILSSVLGYFAMQKAGEDNPKYSLKMISKTAQITSYDIRYWSGREAGSGYSLGELDGSWQSMVNLAPEAIAVSLFRPFLWEVNNPLMLLTALESLVLVIFTIYVLFKARWKVFKLVLQPPVFFCLIFSITFAFAVGVSTFNFGTLARYKIPLLPFYFVSLTLLLNYSNKERNEGVLEVTE